MGPPASAAPHVVAVPVWAYTPAAGADQTARVQVGPSYQRVLVGTALGAVAGAAAGAGLVAITRGDPGDGNMLPWGDVAAGAVLGAVPGMYLGSRIASGGAGNPWLTGATAVGGTALGVLAGVALGTALAGGDAGKAPEVFGIAVGLAVPIGLTSLVEWRTGR
jgi:hypothetical protein